MDQWTLSQSSFDQFLTVLDPNREQAGKRYEALRTRIVKFFEWRACRFPDDLADETLDRVVKKVDAGVEINDFVNYTYGVARLVYLEHYKEQVKEHPMTDEMPEARVADDEMDEDERLNFLEECLKKLSDRSRTMILHYYRDDKQAKIDYRKKLAEKFNISVNALRIKALRIRSMLEECVLKHLGQDPIRNGSR